MGVGAAPGVVVREGPEQQLREKSTIRSVGCVVLAVLETPRGKVGRGEVGGEESVSTGEAYGIGEDSARDGIAWAETRSRLRILRLLGLEADVEFEVVNIAI